MKFVYAITLACVCALALALPTMADTVNVEVFDNEFAPDPTINSGDTIHWFWTGSLPHSSTSVAGLTETWDSGLHSSGFTFDHIFTQVGAFPYYCTAHGFDNGNGTAGGMSGVITVIPEPASLCLFALGSLALISFRKRLGK